MNREWAELNKSMQGLIGKKDTYEAGLEALFRLRGQIMDALLAFRGALAPEAFSAMPFPGAKGYHSKTVAYSLWHIFRIEDIVAHTLIRDDEEVFFRGGYQARTHSPIITTGNELQGREIAAFSAQLDLDALYAYMADVKTSTEGILRALPYEALKTGIPAERKARLESLNVVSADEQAAWLIGYWCGKDIRGLIRMPFSRHWIMHTEACFRIADKLR